VSVLFRVLKGFIYGNVLGLVFGIAFYLFASAVKALGVQSIPDPAQLLALFWGASAVAGAAKEYSDWLEEKKTEEKKAKEKG